MLLLLLRLLEGDGVGVGGGDGGDEGVDDDDVVEFDLQNIRAVFRKCFSHGKKN